MIAYLIVWCLLQPLDAQGVLVPDPSADYELFDRVVNVRDGYSVPLGVRGTIIGIHHGEWLLSIYSLLPWRQNVTKW